MKTILDLVRQLKTQENALALSICADQRKINEVRDRLSTLYWAMDELGIEPPLLDIPPCVTVSSAPLCLYDEGRICTGNHEGCDNFVRLDVKQDAPVFLKSKHDPLFDRIEKSLSADADVLILAPTVKAAKKLKTLIAKAFSVEDSDWNVENSGTALLFEDEQDSEYWIYFESINCVTLNDYVEIYNRKDCPALDTFLVTEDKDSVIISSQDLKKVINNQRGE